MTPNEANGARFTGAAGHYEVWYATFSHLPSRTGFWIRYTLEAPLHGEPYAQLWFARFDSRDPSRTFGINRRFPIGTLFRQRDPFRLTIGEAELKNDGMRGTLLGGGHEVSWDLGWRPSDRVHLHLPDLS